MILDKREEDRELEGANSLGCRIVFSLLLGFYNYFLLFHSTIQTTREGDFRMNWEEFGCENFPFCCFCVLYRDYWKWRSGYRPRLWLQRRRLGS